MDNKGGGGGGGSGGSSRVPAKLVEKFPKSSFISGSVLGAGGFGNVLQGKLRGKDVAVKILHGTIGIKRFSVLEEMSRLEHRNLVKFIGLIETDIQECPQLIFQTAEEGSLLDFVKQKRHLDPKMKPGTLLKLAKDVVDGMEYLHRMDFVHGSLAARNVLLCRFHQYLNAKISDYGMIRVIDGMGVNFFKVLNKTIPIRWMPKEAISEVGRVSEVTKATDAWSFGVVLWEMATFGEVPYGLAMSNTEVQMHILKGSSPLTFKRPDCPPEVLGLMENIFSVDQQNRPKFGDLKIIFGEIYEQSRQPTQQQPAPSARPNVNTESQAHHHHHHESRQRRSEGHYGGRRGRGSHSSMSDRPRPSSSVTSKPRGYHSHNESSHQERFEDRRARSPCKEKSGNDRNPKKFEDVKGRSVKSSQHKHEGGRGRHHGGQRGMGVRRNRSKSKTSVFRDFDKEAANEEKRRIDHSVVVPNQSQSIDNVSRSGNSGIQNSSGPSKTSVAPTVGGLNNQDSFTSGAPGNYVNDLSRLPAAPPAYSEAIASQPNYPGGIYPTRALENEIQSSSGTDKKTELLLEKISQLQQDVAQLKMDNTVNQTVQQRLQEREITTAITKVASKIESISRSNNKEHTAQNQPQRNRKGEECRIS